MELKNNGIGYLAEEISKQSMPSGPSLLLIAKCKRRRRIEEKIVKEKETKLGRYREFLVLSILQKMRKPVLIFLTFLICYHVLSVEKN